VWPQIADWASLGSIAGPLRTGDRVFVSDLSPGFGIAQYNGADWELVQGSFATLADLLAFGGGGELIYTTGQALVGTGDETSVVYYYTGAAWERMPDGSLFIYPSVPDWASLPTADTVINNDEVGVDDLGYTGSSGVAQWHAQTSEWRLIEGKFTSVADMLAFDALYPVHNLAIARVRSTAPFNDQSIVYIYHSGVWTRSGVTTTEGYAWTLTQAQLVSGGDPSGIGAVQEGDYGVFTPAGVPIVVRYKAATTVVAGAGGVAQAQWLPPEVYAGTPTIQAYLVGTEVVSNDVALNAQGWPTVTRTVGTLTSQTTRVRLATTGASADVGFRTLTSGVTTTTKVYARALTRMQVGSGTGLSTAFCILGATNNGTTGAIPAYISQNSAKGTFFWSGSADTSTGVDKASQAAVAGLSGGDDLIELIINTAGGVRTCEMYRNGILVSTTDQVASAVADRCIYQVGSFSTATTSLATMDLSRVMVATW
jgi:hypothetical protein